MTAAASTAPKVSAIMIFLNGETFIAEAIESIMAQTLTDWELILVDDGTTDGATAIAKSYAERYPDKVRFTEHPGRENRGMSASRNRGISLARGEYIAFLDADDVWLPRRLQVHVDILDARPEVAVVMAPTIWWRSWMSTGSVSRKPWLHADTLSEGGLPLDQVIEPPAVCLSYLERRGATLPGICSITVRRAAAIEVGGFNDDFRTLYEDQVFHFRIGLRHRIWVHDEALALYRQHDDSACNREGRVASDVRMRPIFLAWLQDHLVESGCKDPRVWAAFRAEMFRFDQPRIWWWWKLPVRARDWWNVNSRRLWITILSPSGYNRLRKRFGMTYVDPGRT